MYQADISELNHLLSDIHANRWTSLHTTLSRLKELGEEVAGVTKEPTGRKPMQLKGHAQLHREVQELLGARKLMFNLTDPLSAGHQKQLVVLRDSLHKLLQKGPLDSFPTDSPLLTLETFLMESAALVKERLNSIDKELAEVKQANIMEGYFRRITNGD